MRFLAPGLLVLGMLVSLPQTASAQPCQTHSLPELNTIDGTISNADCVMTPFRNARGEFWNLYLNAGETVIITMNRVTMQDPYLYLLNPAAAVVASNDDAVPPNRNSRIQYVAAATGMHRVIATTFALQPTADNGTYEIRAEIAGHPACQVRNLPNATTMNATLDATDCIIQPYRGARGEIWVIAATAGNPIVVNMNRFTITDPYLFLLDAGFQSLASNDDFAPPNRDARISIASAPYTGTYYVVSTTFAASDPGAYSIRFEGTPAAPAAPERRARPARTTDRDGERQPGDARVDGADDRRDTDPRVPPRRGHGSRRRQPRDVFDGDGHVDCGVVPERHVLRARARAQCRGHGSELSRNDDCGRHRRHPDPAAKPDRDDFRAVGDGELAAAARRPSRFLSHRDR